MLNKTKSLRNEVYDQTETKQDDSSYFPYTNIEPLLHNHPLMKVINVKKQDVHSCLSYLFDKTCCKNIIDKTLQSTEGSRSRKQTDANSEANSKANPETNLEREWTGNDTKPGNLCKMCQHEVYTICARDGNIVCSRCGLENRRLFEDNFERYDASEDTVSREQGSSSSTEIPSWAFAKCTYSDTWKNLSVERDVENWNSYVHLKTDDLLVVKRFASSIKKRASDDVRVASAFLFFYIASKFDIDTLTRDNFPVIDFAAPKVYSSCAQCGEKFYEPYAVSRHICTKHKKRAQISLVKNRPAKMKLL